MKWIEWKLHHLGVACWHAHHKDVARMFWRWSDKLTLVRRFVTRDL